MILTQPGPSILQTKQHLKILDGLRGVAAVAVVIFHFMEICIPDYKNNFIAHGYLAVDFFFCLSGFVIAYAYDSRIEEIGILEFLKLRLIRLQPLVIIGAVIGLVAFVFDPFVNLYAKYGAGETFLMFLSSSLLLPYPIVPERYHNLFHLNAPIWSLFWEYIANIFYAIILFRLSRNVLWPLLAAAALLLSYAAFHYGNLGVGWSIENFAGGGARVFYSFLAGMLVYRTSWIIKSRLGFISISLLLLLAFLFPYSDQTNWFVEPLIVIFYFPFLVALGAGVSTNSFATTCTFAGEISYPLYMVHYPFIWIFLSYVETRKPTMIQLEIIVPVAVVLLIIFAYLIMIFLDMPIRVYLKNKLKRSYVQQ